MNSLRYFVVLLLLSLAGFSCASPTGESDDPDPAGPEKRGYFVTLEEAINELDAALAAVDAGTRSRPQRKMAGYHILGGTPDTKTEPAAIPEPLVYLFNFENNEGFALVAGDRRITPVMALTECGNLDPDKEVDNPGLAIFLEHADTYYRAVTGLPIYDENDRLVYYNLSDPARPIPYKPDQPLPLTPLPDSYTTTYTEWNTWGHSGEIIPCQWGQKAPFNKYCFSSDNNAAYVGCVAVAAGQMMYHFGKSVTYDGVYFNWNTMHTVTGPYTGTTVAQNMVYTLLSKLGKPQNLDMDYGAVKDNAGSFASTANVGRTFKNFGYFYGGDIRNYNLEYLSSELTRHPVMVSGYAKRKIKKYKFLGITIARSVSYSDGHAWVIDKKIHQKRQENTYQNGVLISTVEQKRVLLHCNWGWAGSYDGYFFSEGFNVTTGSVPATRASAGWEGLDNYYRFKLETITGIRP